MPASHEETLRIVTIARDYLSLQQLYDMFDRIERDVGHRTDNESLKVTLTALRQAVEGLRKDDRPSGGWPTLALLVALVTLHVGLLVVNVASLFVLPWSAPWYVAGPLCTFLVLLTLSNWPCPLTRLENALRRRLGRREARNFVGHYVVGPVRRYWGWRTGREARRVVR